MAHNSNTTYKRTSKNVNTRDTDDLHVSYYNGSCEVDKSDVLDIISDYFFIYNVIKLNESGVVPLAIKTAIFIGYQVL